MPCAVSPTTSGEVISRFGIRRGITTGRPTFHAGIDLKGRTGDPVYAAAEGIVDRVFDNDPISSMRGYGNVVILRHENQIWTSYNHLSRKLVTEGGHVSKGDLIGYVGNTTNGKFRTMIPHLHFEVRHAKPDGSIPFPGAYGRYNIDPVLWLDANGLDPRTLGPTTRPCVPGARARTSDELRRRSLAGLGVVVPWSDLTEGQTESEYEPPTIFATAKSIGWGIALVGTAVAIGKRP